MGLSHSAVTAVLRWAWAVLCVAIAVVAPDVTGVFAPKVWPVLFGVSAGVLVVAGVRPSLWADVLSGATMAVTFGARGVAVVLAVAATGGGTPIMHLGVLLWTMLTSVALAWPWLMRPTRPGVQ